MNPSYWGLYFWKVIHIAALGYPEHPTVEEQENYKRFYYALGNVLPCKKCSLNYKRHLSAIPVEYFLKDRDELFKWTIHLHNVVNKEIGKPQWSLEYAQTYYKSDIGKYDNTNKTSNKHLFIMMILNAFVVLLFIILFTVFIVKKK